ncbi:MAG: hypothetical protein OIF50_05865 [Flavobacteriaceae bacterium]|nr:hypothetical protein [Flavobacteriaceae bacterium]
MVRLADGLLAFPIGVSKGNRGTIAMAQKCGLPTKMVEALRFPLFFLDGMRFYKLLD